MDLDSDAGAPTSELSPAPRRGPLSRTWSAERLAFVQTAWAAGSSNREIAAELNTSAELNPMQQFPSVTRNAVRGLIYRKGWTGPHSGNQRCRRTVKRLTNHGNRFDVVECLEVSPPPDERPAELFPEAIRCTLQQLTGTTCRWPVGDPQSPKFFFLRGAPGRWLALLRPLRNLGI